MATIKRKICKKCYSNFTPIMLTDAYCSNCKIENKNYCNATDNDIKCKNSCVKNKKFCLHHMIEFADIMDGIFRCNVKGCYNELTNKQNGKCNPCIAGNEPNSNEDSLEKVFANMKVTEETNGNNSGTNKKEDIDKKINESTKSNMPEKTNTKVNTKSNTPEKANKNIDANKELNNTHTTNILELPTKNIQIIDFLKEQNKINLKKNKSYKKSHKILHLL